MTDDELPGHPTNLLLVRVKESARGQLLPDYLYYVFVHLFHQGAFRQLQSGAAQQCIRARDVKALPLKMEAPKSRRRRRPGPSTLGALVEVRSGVKAAELRDGDILLQRVGTCGRPSLVLGTDPLRIRTERSSNPEQHEERIGDYFIVVTDHKGSASFVVVNDVTGKRLTGSEPGPPSNALAAARRIVMRHRNPTAELRPGAFPPGLDLRQLAVGTAVEMEHTVDPQAAQVIASHHLAEHPDYYVALAEMESQLEANPSDPEDWNYYVNFVLYAVLGRMGEADSLMRDHGPAIRRAAATMRRRHRGVPPKLYRGLLLEPDTVKGGAVPRDDQRTFLSFSENEDVACWFAEPGSIMSGFVRQQRPDVRGYMTTVPSGKGAAKRLLWHHTWTTVPLPGRGPLPLVAAAAAHPHIDTDQFRWNMATQAEAILLPGTAPRVKVKPLGSGCPEVDELDARYTFPPFLAQLVR